MTLLVALSYVFMSQDEALPYLYTPNDRYWKLDLLNCLNAVQQAVRIHKV